MKKELPLLSFFSAEELPAICDQLGVEHPVFLSVIQQFGYPPYWGRPASFESLVHIILEQQVSLASALAALNKLKERLVNITPEALLALTDEDLKACYFSRQKTVYARHLAESIINGSLLLPALEAMDNDAVSVQLRQIKGIGFWTVDVYLMMVLHRTDCFPLGDIALVNSMKQELNLPKETTREELQVIAENWTPYRTVAAFMLWHAYLCRRSRNNVSFSSV